MGGAQGGCWSGSDPISMDRQNLHLESQSLPCPIVLMDDTAEQANPNTALEREIAAVEVTYGELVKGESGEVFAQRIRDCQSHLVLHC